MRRKPAASPELRFIRFIQKSADPNSCWIWTGHKMPNGYAQFSVSSRRDGRRIISTKTYAHRFAYEMWVGPIPDGLVIDHLCRRRDCVNPRHLETVTTRENLRRGETKTAHNAAKTHCPMGHELSGDNLYVHTNKNGVEKRHCKTCRKQALRKFRERVFLVKSVCETGRRTGRPIY